MGGFSCFRRPKLGIRAQALYLRLSISVPRAAGLALMLLFFAGAASAQVQDPNTLRDKKKIQGGPTDTAGRQNQPIDTSKAASLTDTGKTSKGDTLNLPVSSGALDKIVNYKAADSIVFDLEKKQAYLYGNTHLDYGQINLEADSTLIDFDKNTIAARGRPDSAGVVRGEPVFKDGEQEIHTRELRYNFKTREGIVYAVSTKQGEGEIRGEKTKFKRIEGQDVVYVKNARYSTCDLPHQHFYIGTNKLKLIPKEKVITGPAYLVIEDVRLPIILPFGYFPAQSRKSSGIIIPLIGQSQTQGFALRNGGYYFGKSDYYDLAFTGDIYTNGTYRIAEKTRYARRYRFSGDFNINFARNRFGLAETPTFRSENNFSIVWRHVQDAKARPGQTFSADVNIATQKYNQLNTYNVTAIATQNLSSKITYTKQLFQNRFNMNMSLGHDQVLSQKSISITAPDFSFNAARFNPLSRKNAVGRKRWYEDINMTYSMRALNRLRTYDSLLLRDLQERNFENGATHSIPIQYSANVFRYFNVTPRFTYNGFLYTRRDNMFYNEALRRADTLTSKGFYYAQSFNVSAGISTLIYGMARIPRGRIMAIRQILQPVMTLNYAPDFSKERYGYYGRYSPDSASFAAGKMKPYYYYSASGQFLGGISAAPMGGLTFALNSQSFEAKVRTKDTLNPEKKIKLLENASISSGYNFLLDSFRMQPIEVQGFTVLFEKLSMQGGFTVDPYYLGPYRREKDFSFSRGAGLGRITTGNLNAGISLNKAPTRTVNRVMYVQDPRLAFMYQDVYANFSVPLDLRLNYTLLYTLDQSSRDEMTQQLLYKKEFNQSINFSGDLNLTSTWKVAYETTFDLRQKKAGVSKFSVFKDLHCWQMSFSWIPTGPARSYFFNIHIKASSLSDVKFDRRKEFFDY